MVDINTSSSALQAQLQASKTPRPSERDGPRAPTPQDVVSQRVEARKDIPLPDRRAPIAQPASTNGVSTSSEIEEASRRAEEFSLTREAPGGRFSNAPENTRPQPLGQIVNILV